MDKASAAGAVFVFQKVGVFLTGAAFAKLRAYSENAVFAVTPVTEGLVNYLLGYRKSGACFALRFNNRILLFLKRGKQS